MKIRTEDFTVGDLYQLMTGTSRKSYEPMPMWGVLAEKLSKRAKLEESLNDQLSPVTKVCITTSPFEERGVDFVIFINPAKFFDNYNSIYAPIHSTLSMVHFDKTSDFIVGRWYKYIEKNPHSFIDRVVLIDDSTTIPESAIEGERACMELYKRFEGVIEDIRMSFTSTSFHQYNSCNYYFGEEFREYIDSSSTDINQAILGYVSCLIPLYIADISFKNSIEKVLFDGVGNVMRAIEEKNEQDKNNKKENDNNAYQPA